MNNYMLNKSVDDSHIYLNLSIHNDSKTNDIKAFYQRTFDEVILQDPSQYEMSVIRFALDGMDIPILNLRNFLQTGSSINTALIIRFVYLGNNYEIPVVWAPFAPTIDEERKYYLYDYDQLCTLMNTTFQNLTNIINGITPGLISQSPIIAYNPEIQRFTLYAEKAVFTDNIIGGVQIWFGQLLYDLFQSLPFNSFSAGGFIKLKIDRVLNPLSNTTVDNSKTINAIDHWAMIQNYNTLSQQNTAQSIVIQSDLPIINEYINSIGQSQAGLTTIQLPIVSDFIIDPENGYEMFKTISYSPSAEYRMIDMVNSSPLNKVSLNFYWQDKQGILHPLDISPLRTITVKILFRRKGYHAGKQPSEIENTNTKQLRRY